MDIPSIDSFEEARKKVEIAKGVEIPVVYEQRSDLFGNFFTFMWPFLLIIGLYVFLFRKMNSQSGGGYRWHIQCGQVTC